MSACYMHNHGFTCWLDILPIDVLIEIWKIVNKKNLEKIQLFGNYKTIVNKTFVKDNKYVKYLVFNNVEHNTLKYNTLNDDSLEYYSLYTNCGDYDGLDLDYDGLGLGLDLDLDCLDLYGLEFNNFKKKSIIKRYKYLILAFFGKTIKNNIFEIFNVNIFDSFKLFRLICDIDDNRLFIGFKNNSAAKYTLDKNENYKHMIKYNFCLERNKGVFI